MRTVFIEATQDKRGGAGNWGKFMVGRFEEHEGMRMSEIAPGFTLLGACGWGDGARDFVVVIDLQTGEGAIFKPTGYAKADLDKHKVWVCPLFEPFLTWLYTQNLTDLESLPHLVELPDAEFAMAGYRRTGPEASSPEADVMISGVV